MNRRQLGYVICTVILLLLFTVLLTLRDRQNANEVPLTSDPRLFHSAIWLPPIELGGNRIRKIISSSRILYVDESLLLERETPRRLVSLRLPVPTDSSRNNDKFATYKEQQSEFNYVEIFIQLDPEKRAVSSNDQLKQLLESESDVGLFIDPRYPALSIYSKSSKKNRPGWYKSNDSTITIPNGDPIVFLCTEWGRELGNSWGYCQGTYRIFDDMLVKIRFNSTHLTSWRTIFEKSIETLQQITRERK